MTISPAEFMSATPKSLNGSSPWSVRYAGEIRRIWLAHAAEDARTLQTHLGPSELGVPCDRQVVGKLAALPATNHVVDPWPSMRGRALHKFAEEVFGADNLRRTLRWLTEHKVTPHDEHPGTADLYDLQEESVDDHKFLGESSLAKIRKIQHSDDWKTKAASWPRHYLVQLLLYGLGYLREGRRVRRVVLIAYPATAASLDGLYVADLEFSDEHGNVLPEVIELLQTVFDETAHRKVLAGQVTAGHLDFMDVPAAPNDDDCYFCPFYRPQAARDGLYGCPGPRPITVPGT